MVTGLKKTRQDDSDLYDDVAGYTNTANIAIAQGLTDQERKQAKTFLILFDNLWGVCIVKGEPGAGKDTFGNYLSYNLRRYFPNRTLLRSERPTRLFGKYDGLFNEEVLADEIGRMREVSKGTAYKDRIGVMDKAADEWVTEEGRVLLQNSVLYTPEYWKWCYNREPFNPMNRTMGGIHRQIRHLNAFIIGSIQDVTELDKKTCLPYVKWRVTCVRSKIDTSRYSFFVERVKYDPRQDLLIEKSRAFSIPVDAGKPRSFIGDGKIIIKRPDYLPETEEERVVLEAIKSGIDNYEHLVEILSTVGDMSERETLDTLKTLCLWLPNRPPKFVIWYPCYYFIFNSQSAPNMRTSLRMSD